MTGAEYDTRAIGRQAEEAACRHLTAHGLTLLARNFRCRRGEIDLVMQERDCVVFVEVRCRNNPRFGGPLESVDWKKREKLAATAQYYLQTHVLAAQQSARFDVIAVILDTPPARIEWIRDAFRV
jgi:putative endonuclease